MAPKVIKPSPEFTSLFGDPIHQGADNGLSKPAKKTKKLKKVQDEEIKVRLVGVANRAQDLESSWICGLCLINIHNHPCRPRHSLGAQSTRTWGLIGLALINWHCRLD